MNKDLKIKFCSGVGTVTGANFLLETPKGTKLLIDCGMVQGEKFAEEVNAKAFTYNPSEIKYLIITHAHLDHVGRIPKLVKDGFRGMIYSTPVTKELAELVLTDAVRILNEEAKRSNSVPMYDLNDVSKVFPLWQTIPYHSAFNIDDEISIFLKDAGHILGSAMVEMSVKGVPQKGTETKTVKILFTGDLGNSPAPLLRDSESVGDVDYIVMESTYGNKNHEPKEQRVTEFERIIKETLGRGGTLVIPAFSIDRTQVLLFELNNMVEQKRIPSVPVFVDSPMATKATEIYKQNSDLFNETVKSQIDRGDNIFSFPHLKYTMSQSESGVIDRINGSKIILAGSGMSVGGRVIGHEEYFLPDPENTILFVGYQTAGSLGRRLSEGEKSVNIHGNKIDVRAHIETLYGYSAHKDGDHLLEFVATATDLLKKVFVVMGEPSASMFFAQRVNNELNTEAALPEKEVEYLLQ